MPGWAQDESWAYGDWVFGPAGDSDVPVALSIGVDGAELRQLGAVGRWRVLPAGIDRSGREGLRTELGFSQSMAQLASGDWTALLAPTFEDRLVLWVPDVSEPGFGWATGPIGDELQGEWMRAEPTPVGPRLRRLLLHREQLVLYDRLDRETRVPAAGLGGGGDEPRLVLFPEDGDATGVRLLPVNDCYVVTGSNSDPVQIVYRPDRQPAWLEPDWPGSDAALALLPRDSPLRGRWLVQTGSDDRLAAIIDLETSPPRWISLGAGSERSVAPTAAESTFARLVVGEGERAERWDLAVSAAGWGVLWPTEGGRPARLWRIDAVDPLLLGDWVVEASGSWMAERIVVEETEIGRPFWGEAQSVAGLGGGDGARRLAMLREGRSGRLITLHWIAGLDAWLTESGDVWYRPDSRPTVASACDATLPALGEHLSACIPEQCSTPADCGALAGAIVRPLQCTERQVEEAERRFGQACQDLWPNAFESGFTR